MMQRRVLLRGFAATTAAAVLGHSGRLAASVRHLRVGVVGGGILGSSIAWSLAAAGARVLLLEKLEPAAGATQKSFGFINLFDADRHYQQLRLASLIAYREIDAALGLGITWGGYLNWASSAAEAAALAALAAPLEGTSYEVRQVDRDELRQISAAIQPGSIVAAFYSPHAGHVDPAAVSRRLLEGARALGVQARYPCEVLGLEVRAGRLPTVRTSAGPVLLDRVVIAAGVGSPALLAGVGHELPLRHAPGILAHSVPTRELVKLVCDGPDELEFKQTATGRLVGELHFEPPDIPVHREIRAGAADFTDDALREQHGRRILDRIATVLPGARGVSLEKVTLGFRPMPIDGFPIIGPVPGVPEVYVAVTHSGVTLAPILGRLAAREIVTGEAAAELAPYRPTRFVNQGAGGTARASEAAA